MNILNNFMKPGVSSYFQVIRNYSKPVAAGKKMNLVIDRDHIISLNIVRTSFTSPNLKQSFFSRWFQEEEIGKTRTSSGKEGNPSGNR